MDAPELRAKCTQLKNRIRALTSSIEANAGTALNGGGPETLQQVKAWQAERREAVDELELVEAALRSPEAGSELDFRLQRIDARCAAMQGDWSTTDKRGRTKRSWQGQLRTAYVDALLSAATREDALILLDGHPHPVFLDQLAPQIAADLTGEAECQVRINGAATTSQQWGGVEHVHDYAQTPLILDNKTKRQELTAELAILKRHTARLLAETVLPPVPDAYQTRLAKIAKTRANSFGHPTQATRPSEPSGPPRGRPSKEERRRLRRESMPPDPLTQRQRQDNPFNDPAAQHPHRPSRPERIDGRPVRWADRDV